MSRLRPRVPMTLSGWGCTAPGVSQMRDVRADDLAEAVKDHPVRGTLLRGLGRSYGDAAQNSGGDVVRLHDSIDSVSLDASAGTVTAGAGVSLDSLMRFLVPRGWFVPVTPGTRIVTLGGAIACDIHGKNHHLDGSFGSHVVRMSLLLADGTIAEISPSQRPDLFWATVGGMGLTGAIVDATIRLLPVETSLLRVETRRVPNLDTLIGLMSEGDHLHRYSVAWIDIMPKGESLGRSVLTWGDHASLSDLDERSSQDPLAFDARQRIAVPPLVPAPGFINRLTVGAFNEMWYRKAPRHRVGELQSIPSYFHPLDAVGMWNRAYGPGGFVQYQFTVPFGEEDGLRRVMELLADSGAASFLAVLKRFGDGNPAPLSFPQPGWTLALDVPAPTAGLSALFGELDRIVVDCGGRHYLAKDSHMSPATLRAGYPRLDEWKAIRDSVDPIGVWQSDLGRRLGLVDSPRHPSL